MTKLEVAIQAYKSAKTIEVVSRNVEAEYEEDDFQSLKPQLEKHDLINSISDKRFKIAFQLPHELSGFFALNLDEILESTERQISPPSVFYLADIDYLFQGRGEETPNDINNYLDIAGLVETLSQLADHFINANSKAIFLHGEKLELSLKFQKKDLKPLPELGKFIVDFIDAEIHKEQKVTIIKSVLFEMLKSNEIHSFTLPNLIDKFSDFVERIYANYALYVSEFSFEKIRNQIEMEKFEFTLKINKVFSDIQNQLLAVPVALILVGSQMKTAESLTIQNFTIWLGSLVFGFFMSLLIRNQGSTLKAIKLEFDSQWSTIKQKHQLVSDRLNGHYEQIERKYLFQKAVLGLVSFIIASSVIVSTVLLLLNSNEISKLDEVLLQGSIGGLIYIFACIVWSKKENIKRTFIDRTPVS